MKHRKAASTLERRQGAYAKMADTLREFPNMTPEDVRLEIWNAAFLPYCPDGKTRQELLTDLALALARRIVTA